MSIPTVVLLLAFEVVGAMVTVLRIIIVV